MMQLEPGLLMHTYMGRHLFMKNILIGGTKERREARKKLLGDVFNEL